MTDALVVIGDVHGEVEQLAAAFASADDGRRTVILVGDYVNRGPSSSGVLDLLCSRRRELGDRLVLLRGNHEQALLDFLDGGPVADIAAHGGLATLHSYLGDWPGADGQFVERRFRAVFPSEHRELLESTRLCFEVPGLLVSHAGFDPADVSRRDLSAMTRGSPAIFDHRGPWPAELTVCGHHVQVSTKPWLSHHLIALDTGCGTLPDGRLTALWLPERTVRQY